ncbi:MAG: MerR family transcriptional regulator, heat shock protein HspR [Chloroflexota bacterium]|jgi:MerR family transcriptional regulator/heat shock protein HspR|nr:MerR family transcriptional regulator, heat shock protein HspR [Chloroflexota bacterium]
MMEFRGEINEATGYFAISAAARLLGVHAQTLRAYERQGLITPSRSKGRIRLYSVEDIRRAQLVRRLIEDLGVNLAGVEVIIRLTERIRLLEEQLAQTQEQLQRLQRTAPNGTRARN